MEKKNDNEFGKLSKQETHTENNLFCFSQVPTPNHDSTGCKMRGFFIARLKLN
jgi:hypothetical protein